MESDGELIQRILTGRNSPQDPPLADQKAAFCEFVNRYERLVRAIALNKTGDHHRAEDAAQEVFVEAFRSLHRLKDHGCFAAWLMRIANRVAGRHQFRAARMPVVAGDVDASVESDQQQTDSTEQIAMLVARLPDHERIVIGLRHFEGLSVADIATRLSRPVGTVTQQLSRAHQRLRRWWQDEEQS